MGYQSESESGDFFWTRFRLQENYSARVRKETETVRCSYPHSRSAVHVVVPLFFVSGDKDLKEVTGTVPDTVGIKLKFYSFGFCCSTTNFNLPKL